MVGLEKTENVVFGWCVTDLGPILPSFEGQDTMRGYTLESLDLRWKVRSGDHWGTNHPPHRTRDSMMLRGLGNVMEAVSMRRKTLKRANCQKNGRQVCQSAKPIGEG